MKCEGFDCGGGKDHQCFGGQECFELENKFRKLEKELDDAIAQKKHVLEDAKRSCGLMAIANDLLEQKCKNLGAALLDSYYWARLIGEEKQATEILKVLKENK